MFTLRLFKIKMHTRRVLIFKRSLPVFAFLLACLMLLWPILLAEQKEQFSLAVQGSSGMKGARVDMEKVRFFSQDKKKQPFEVTASRVLETDPQKQQITLYKPVARYQMEKALMTAKSPYGLADQKNETLFFEEETTATTDTGYQVVSSKILCDNKTGVISGPAPITVTGPSGQLKAVGFKLYNKGDNIDFYGHTDTTLTSSDGPIHVTSKNGLLIDQSTQTITALQSVKATQSDKIITADQMILTYWTKDQNPDSRVKEIIAAGHVVARSPDNKVTGGHGVYNPKTGIIVMHDNVTFYQGGSHITGDKATINLTTGESDLVPKKTTSGKPERVRGRLIPTELKGNKK